MDLFSPIPFAETNVTAGESNIEEKNKIDVQICDSREVIEKSPPEVTKHIENEPLHQHSTPQVIKIVFFYADSSFEVFHPNKK
jgi:hypothetical protein